MKLVPLLHRIVADHFERIALFQFGWRWKLPVLIISRRELKNFADQLADNAVYETAQAFRHQQVNP